MFISSINGRVSFPFTGIYNASKYAIEAVADCLRVELRPFGVQVALIEPGVIDTDPWHEMDQIIDALEADGPRPRRDLEPGPRGFIHTCSSSGDVGFARPSRVGLGRSAALTLVP